MNDTMIHRITRAGIRAIICLAMVSTSAAAADYYLRADVTTKVMPDGVAIPMWGFAQDSAFGAMDGAVTVPGPALIVPPGDTTLTIHLDNNLSEPISIVIPGQIATMTPVKFTDAQGRARVRSFTHETPADNTAEVTYTWTNLMPGTFLYLSGSHPAVQVQMGLYGAVLHDAAGGEVYAGITYDTSLTMLYSEIDPALHEAVNSGNYVPFGDPATSMTSTMDYQPKYFLINGEPYASSMPTMPAGAVGDRVLVRFLNAGLRTHTPMLLGMHMSVVAENGYPYSYPRAQYTLGLPAGQTRDAILEPAASGTHAILDRMLNLTNAGGLTPGGMLRILEVTP